MLSKHHHLITNLTSFDNEERIFLLHLNMMKSCLRLMVNFYIFCDTNAIHRLEGSDCRYDGIQVYDGPSINHWQLGRLCGNQRSTFHSTGKTLTVRFTTDSSQTYQGFRAEYRVVGESQKQEWRCINLNVFSVYLKKTWRQTVKCYLCDLIFIFY